MGRLPFETGYLSTMSDRELAHLSDELERGSFWNNEETIFKMVNDYMERQWRQSGPKYPTYYPAPSRQSATYYNDEGPTLTVAVQQIRLNIPDFLDERTARLFAEIQIREQLDPNYDPTEAEV